MKPLTPVLLLLALSGCSSSVVPNFTQTCPQFFANPDGIVSPPTVFQRQNYKQICQMQNNTYEFATLYDTANRIPVYSAYKFEGIMGCKRKTNWHIEPQLDNSAAGGRMGPDRKIALPNQAVKADYTGTSNHGYEKGHLAPVYHARSQSCSNATFTLTNAAPQNCSFNHGKWETTEIAVANYLVKNCSPNNSTFIVTGVVPGPKKLKNRVRIPSHFWTAFCCLDNNLKVKASRGFLGKNKNDPVQNMTISNLEGELSNLYGTVFSVFGGRLAS
uniref:Endonuclease domain-containing 1 protein-like n=1 Tax=Pygocentrus nattereri TaxID=42514 RepID=A0A3B4E0X5_PYGNA